jgi:hypothetical protein
VGLTTLECRIKSSRKLRLSLVGNRSCYIGVKSFEEATTELCLVIVLAIFKVKKVLRKLRVIVLAV